MQSVEETYFTVDEVADKLKVSHMTIYRWIKAGELAAYKIGGEFRITERDIERFLEARRTLVRREPVKGELYLHRPAVADGRALKRLRRQKDLSVRELADQADVSTSVIYRLEKGRAREAWAEIHTIRNLAEALGVEPTELLGE